MINYFYSIYKKRCGTKSYIFYRSFSIFIFMLIFSVFGFGLLILNYFIKLFYHLDFEYLLIIDVSVSIVYPLMRILYPGYEYLKKTDQFSNEKLNFIFFSSLVLVFIIFLFFLQFSFWEMYPNETFSITNFRNSQSN